MIIDDQSDVKNVFEPADWIIAIKKNKKNNNLVGFEPSKSASKWGVATPMSHCRT